MLLSQNAKLEKANGTEWLNLGLSLSPAGLSGKQFCPHRSAGCELACINTSGRGQMKNVQDSRLKKSRYFIENRTAFLAELKADIASALRKADKKGMRLAVRLNVFSDLPWHNLIDMAEFPRVQFYDYTPNAARMIEFIEGKLPSNYHLTFSRKENNQSQVELISSMGGNVAVVFDKLPATYLNKPVIDGDKTDLRFLDPANIIVGLKVKGKGKKDETGFVIQTVVE